MTRMLFGSLSRVGSCCLLTLSLLRVAVAGDYPPRKYAVELTASIQETPPKIALTWPGDPDSQGYRVSKRRLDSGWQTIANLGGEATSFEDSNVQTGQVYEYQLVKQWTGPAGVYNGYGYIRSGIKAPLGDLRGKIILLVENSIANALGGELDQLRRDLIGDGWQVSQQNVSINDSPVSVREIIRNAYNADPGNVKAVLLLGHVPVPYSGNIVPDGHENHQGAWPADVYYGDVDGSWTDSYVNNSLAERDSNWNTPGDGKLDQSEPPSNVELQVGRVDLSNMTCYANKSPSRSEVDLMRQYFQKDHSFRYGALNVARRGVICDNF